MRPKIGSKARKPAVILRISFRGRHFLGRQTVLRRFLRDEDGSAGARSQETPVHEGGVVQIVGEARGDAGPVGCIGGNIGLPRATDADEQAVAEANAVGIEAVWKAAAAPRGAVGGEY